MTAGPSLINPGPAVNPAKNPHRVGAPNHLQASGEDPMVGSTTHPGETTVDALRALLGGQTHRFITVGPGGLTVHMAGLVDVVAEIVTDQVAAEREALAEDMAWNLNTARTAVLRAAGEA
jgi:hypothetical protein